tara:strand:+ start:2204 stop:3967 length:1764 start_codon:yes stop_codon:yes gene_type:complete
MSSSKTTKLLVTTGLNQTWGQKESLILLGQWCKSYDNINLTNTREYVTIDYHWNNNTKFRKDYDYLEGLFERVLTTLVVSLNNFHKTKYSKRYWRIILGPWLLSYVSVLWDRWENIRVAFEAQNFDSTIGIILNSDKLVAENFDNWSQLIINDLWNHHIYNEIIDFHYKEKVNFQYLTYSGIYPSKKLIRNASSYKQTFITLIDRLFGKIQKNYKVIFVTSYFSLFNLIRISLKLKQLPRLHTVFSKVIDVPSGPKSRSIIDFNLNINNPFEEYLKINIAEQIPKSYLESYRNFNKEADLISCDGDLIFTANDHLRNDLFNVWCAGKVEQGKKLVIGQHGGGIKSDLTVFRHQEKIANKMIVWHKPLEDIHVQLPPSKLINIQKKKTYKSELTIVGYEPQIYTSRAQSGPKGDGILDDFLQTLKFCHYLSDEAQDSIRVRSNSHGQGFFNSGLRYKNELGEDKISNHIDLYEAYNHSKIIVCTYPQTTFSEALNFNIPTILLCNEDVWEIDKNFHSLVSELKRNKIFFTTPEEASKHINCIWSNPELWWNKIETKKARDKFLEICGRTSKNWASEWTDFFNKTISDS